MRVPVISVNNQTRGPGRQPELPHARASVRGLTRFGPEALALEDVERRPA